MSYQTECSGLHTPGLASCTRSESQSSTHPWGDAGLARHVSASDVKMWTTTRKNLCLLDPLQHLHVPWHENTNTVFVDGKLPDAGQKYEPFLKKNKHVRGKVERQTELWSPQLSVVVVWTKAFKYWLFCGEDTYIGIDAAAVGDATPQRPGCRAVVIHVDRPVFVLLTTTALKLPKNKQKKVIRVVLQGLTSGKKRLHYL